MTSTHDNPLATTIQDTGPFIYIGRGVLCNGTPWRGRILASPAAIYILQIRWVKSNAIADSGTGQADSPMLVVDALATFAMAAPPPAPATCLTRDLPPAVRRQLDPANRFGDRGVIIIPRSTVSLVKANPFNNAVGVHVGTDRFCLVTSLLRMWQIPRQLRSLGWPLNQQLTPDAPPAHYRCLVRPAVPRRLTLPGRIALVLAALLFLAGLVAGIYLLCTI